MDQSTKETNQEIQAVLWDMDGVLVDTSKFHFMAWTRVMKEYGLELDFENFKTAFGLKNERIIEKFLNKPYDPELFHQIEERKESIFRQLIKNNVTVLPGVHHWLDKFQSLHILQAVASSAPKENIDLLLESAGIRGYFSAVVSADSLPSKPDPAVFLKAASLLHIPQEKCVVIEDAFYGIQAAHHAGMKCIAVGNSLPLEELNQADLVVPRLVDLTEEAFFNLSGTQH
ncbi:MAG: beta-phosphoglucomutase family hydrolase [Anaerolineaceae bacterium]